MTRWIRWGGLIAFVVVVGAVTAFWLLFLDGLVKRLIEREGTRIVGAKVELRGASVTLAPLGVTLTGLQVTDPERPMSNAVEVGRIAFTLDGLNLLRRKVIIDELTAAGIRFGTPRAASGAVARKPSEPGVTAKLADLAGTIHLPSLQMPDVKDILAKEDLESLKIINGVRADVQTEKETWDRRLKELPGKETFAKYRARVEELKGATKGGVAGVLGGVQEVQALKADIEHDIESVKTAQKEFESRLASFRTRLDQAIKAPQEDVRRLQAKYGLSPEGLAHLSGPLLGQQLGHWAGTAVVWYRRLEPFLSRPKQAGGEQGPVVVKPVRGKGLDVRFAEHHPLPDFLVRTADVSLQLDVGELAGKIENLTPDQDVLDRPTTVTLAGEKLKDMKSVALHGTLNHVHPSSPEDTVSLRLAGYGLRDLALSEADAFPVTVTHGLADAKLDATVRGQALNARLTGGLTSLKLTGGKPEDANPIARALGSAVAGVSSLTFDAAVTGTVDQYEVHLSTDLDRVLKDAAGRLVQDQMGRLERELTTAVTEKVSGPLKELQGTFGGLNGIGGELLGRVTQGNDLLDSLVKQAIPQKSLPGGFKLPF